MIAVKLVLPISILLVAIAVHYLTAEMDFSSYMAGHLSKMFIWDVFPRNHSKDEVNKVREMLLTASKTGSEQTLRYVRAVYDLNISSHANNEINVAVRIYQPYHQVDAVDPQAMVLWVHGGGFVFGGLDAEDGICSRLSNHTGFLVVSASYRLAPENKYPAPVEDIVSVLRWMQTSQQLRTIYGGDNDRIFLAGESAGGNLVAAVAAINADEQKTPAKLAKNIRGLLLVYPCLEHGVLRDSHFRYSHTNGVLTLKQMQWFWSLYLTDQVKDCQNYTACPLRTPPKLLRRFPPTSIILAKHDILLDEGIEFANRLHNNKVQVDVIVYNSTVHGFFGRYGPGGEALEYAAKKLLHFASDARA